MVVLKVDQALFAQNNSALWCVIRCVLRQEIHSFSFGRSVVVDNQRRPPRSQAAIETIASSYVEDVPKVRLFNLSPDTKIAVRTVLYYSIH
jgi:hypothetical protein